jgi:hypothetical protein
VIFCHFDLKLWFLFCRYYYISHNREHNMKIRNLDYRLWHNKTKIIELLNILPGKMKKVYTMICVKEYNGEQYFFRFSCNWVFMQDIKSISKDNCVKQAHFQ